jgi:hypothetical protein
VQGTGDGRPDFYAFQVTQEMLDREAARTQPGNVTAGTYAGVDVSFDIDSGYSPGDSVVWASLLRLWELEDPLDPDLPRQPTLLATGSLRGADTGSSPVWFGFSYDGYLTYRVTQPGTYYIEVNAFGRDGVPAGVDYELPRASVEQHAEDTFLFRPAAGRRAGTGQQPQPGARQPNYAWPGSRRAADRFLDRARAQLLQLPRPDHRQPDLCQPGHPDHRLRIPLRAHRRHRRQHLQTSTASTSGPIPADQPLVSVQTTSIFATGDTTNTLRDATPYYSSVTYSLTGKVKAGDVWKLGLGYRDFATARDGRHQPVGHCHRTGEPDRRSARLQRSRHAHV